MTWRADFGSLPGSTSDVEKAAPAYIEWWEARAGRATGTVPEVDGGYKLT